MKSEIHKIIDEKINVYKENARFLELLENYNKTQNIEIKQQMWIIALRCAANFLKKCFGSYWSYEQIEDLSIDMLVILFNRIDNKIKYPNGYKIQNLPKTIEYLFLTCYHSPQVKLKREMENKQISYEEYEGVLI